MKTHCPACGAEMTLDIIINHEAAREAVASVLAMDKQLGKTLVSYLSLFRPSKRSLSFDRVASLLQELVPMIAEGQVTRGGQHYATPRELWKVAIETVIGNRDTLKLPLKSHGYLLEVLVSMVEKHEARIENLKEQQRQGVSGLGSHRNHTAMPQAQAPPQQHKKQPMPDSVKQELSGLKKKIITTQNERNLS